MWNFVLDLIVIAFTNTGKVITEFDETELYCQDCKEGAERETRVRDMYKSIQSPTRLEPSMTIPSLGVRDMHLNLEKRRCLKFLRFSQH